MINAVTDDKTAGNERETLSDAEFLKGLADKLDTLIATADHLDEMVHGIDQRVTGIAEFIDEHRPALARGLALMGGPKLGAWRKPKGKGLDQ